MKEPVFDIVNCGPRNRFVANGKLVHNSGRVVQLQNLPRPDLVSPETAIEFIITGDIRLLKAVYDEAPMSVLSSCLRAVITTSEGKWLNVSDLGSIESRLLGWHSGCRRINETFAAGLDTYREFATHLYNIPYHEVTGKQRFFCKPPTLGCFAADTQVLTDQGWVDIVGISNQHRLWDGQEWVMHDGVIFQGKKDVVRHHGVSATPDHRIRTGRGWELWGELLGENLIRATKWASGSFWSSTETTGCVGALAALLRGKTQTILMPEKQNPAYSVRIENELMKDQQLPRSAYLRRSLTGLLTGFTRNGGAAKIQQTRTTGTMAPGALSAGSIVPKSRSRTISLLKGGTTPLWRLIEKTITDTTRPETYGSRPDQRISTTPVRIEQWYTKVWNILLRSSGKKKPQDTEPPVQLCEKSVKEYPENRSSQISQNVRVNTYDVLNSGPRNQFTILTDKGPVIAHNCGYRLGWQGLIAYAEKMGVIMTEDEAKHAVTVYRSAYPEVKEMWYGLERMFEACLLTGQDQLGYGVRVMTYSDMLAVVLPSGRCIHYHKPAMENTEMPWSTPEKPVFKDVFTAMGENRFTHKWERQALHSGWLTENIVQASARDVMGVWLLRAEEAGFATVLHSHDELGCEEEYDRLEELQELIRQPIDWYPGLLLEAEGYCAKRYRKG